MSRLGGAGAVAQLVADVPLSAVEANRYLIQPFSIEGTKVAVWSWIKWPRNS